MRRGRSGAHGGRRRAQHRQRHGRGRDAVGRRQARARHAAPARRLEQPDRSRPADHREQRGGRVRICRPGRCGNLYDRGRRPARRSPDVRVDEPFGGGHRTRRHDLLYRHDAGLGPQLPAVRARVVIERRPVHRAQAAPLWSQLGRRAAPRVLRKHEPGGRRQGRGMARAAERR